MKKFLKWFKGLTDTKQVLLIVAIVIATFAVAGAMNPTHMTNTAAKKAVVKSSTTAPKVTYKTVAETQGIPFNNQNVNDSSLAKGTNQVTTAGVNGSQTLTYKVTYTNGTETNRQLTKTDVTKQPVTQVTSIGTYVAPAPAPAPAPSSANTYTNVDGNQVESPDGDASGATGVCNDGTYTQPSTTKAPAPPTAASSIGYKLGAASR